MKKKSPSIKEILNSHPYPKWISSHNIWDDKLIKEKGINKVFPGIGLPNSEEKIQIDNGEKATRSAKSLLNSIRIKFNNKKIHIQKYLESHPNLANDKIAELNNIKFYLNAIWEKLNTDNTQFLTETNGKIALKLPTDISLEGANKATFRKGESLFRVYNKLNEMLQDVGINNPLSDLDTVATFKKFSSENTPNKYYSVIFSSDPWDLCTMSSRNTWRSCQTTIPSNGEARGEYAHCTIGSMIDPFVGIIYYTSGDDYNGLGKKMLKRCIVRFCVNEETRKPTLVLDQMYPQHDDQTARIFIDFIKSKVNEGIEVVYTRKDHDKLQKLYIPITEVRKRLEGYDEFGDDDPQDYLDSIQSYQDTHIPSKKSLSRDTQAVLYEKNSKKKKQKFINLIEKSFTEIDLNNFIENTQLSDKVKAALSLKNRAGYANIFHILGSAGKVIAKETSELTPQNLFLNSNLYHKRLHQSVLLKKQEILKKVKTKLVREFNSSMNLPRAQRLTGTEYATVLNHLLKCIEPKIKESLKKVLEKQEKQKTGSLNLPK